MVDTISNAKSIRHSGSATTRYGAPPATSDPAVSDKAIAPASALSNSTERDPEGGAERESQREPHTGGDGSNLRLEISEDGAGSEVVYRFVDAESGKLVRQWAAGEFGQLREYLREKKIHLLDKKV